MQRVVTVKHHVYILDNPRIPRVATEERLIDLSQIPEAALELESCGGCGVQPGEAHAQVNPGDCDWAHCPDCGEQLLLHDCEHWDEDADGPDRPSIWHGVRPDTDAAVKAGYFFWHPAPDINRYVPDEGMARARLEWNPETQKYRV
ncbi:hypothetical protein [Saccharopolyspora griseoalba]|uniref:Uncharacterized protein n=1 Tax=Saccharopolyspora griseoalba TaxID=1431848 RepID=A0ABW2LSG4_9PSEU